MHCFLIYSQFLPRSPEPSLKTVDSGDQDIILEFDDDYGTEDDIIFKFGNSSAFISPESIDGISVEKGGENIPILLLYPSSEVFDEEDEPSQLFTNADDPSAGSNIAAYTLAFTVSGTSSADAVNLVFRGQSDKFIDFNSDAPMWQQDPATVSSLISVLRNIIRAPGAPGVYPEFYVPGVFRFDMSAPQYEPLEKLVNYAASNLGIAYDAAPVYVTPAAPAQAQPQIQQQEPAQIPPAPQIPETPVQTPAPAQPEQPQPEDEQQSVQTAANARSGGLLARLRGIHTSVTQERDAEAKLPTITPRDPLRPQPDMPHEPAQSTEPADAAEHNDQPSAEQQRTERPRIDVSLPPLGGQPKQPASMPPLSPMGNAQPKASPGLPPIHRAPQPPAPQPAIQDDDAQPQEPTQIPPAPQPQSQTPPEELPAVQPQEQAQMPSEPQPAIQDDDAQPQEQPMPEQTGPQLPPQPPVQPEPPAQPQRPAQTPSVQVEPAQAQPVQVQPVQPQRAAFAGQTAERDIFTLSGIKLERGLGARMMRQARDLEIALMAATAAKGFTILGGLNGAGKTRLALDFAETIQSCDAETSATLIPVSADWRDSSDLLGCRRTTSYASDFMSTEFNEALIDCCDNPRRSVFVILEEMTLARPEFYMAEILSAMELREQEIIPCGSRKCRLPKSLFIIGTANMDEAPCPFSPKVLDRCFYIRMRAGDVQFDGGAPAGGTTFREAGLRFIDIMRGDESALYPLADSISTEINIEGLLSAINGAQGNHSVAFGYRTRDEIYSFMANFMYISGCTSYDPSFALRALDWAVVTKLLPKFRGMANDLNSPLEALERRLQEKGLLSRMGPDSMPWRSRGELSYIRHQLDTKSSASYC